MLEILSALLILPIPFLMESQLLLITQTIDRLLIFLGTMALK